MKSDNTKLHITVNLDYDMDITDIGGFGSMHKDVHDITHDLLVEDVHMDLIRNIDETTHELL